MNSVVLLTPEIFVSIIAFVVMLGEAFWPNAKQIWIKLAIFALNVTGVYLIIFFINKAVPFAGSIGVEPVVSDGLLIQYEPVLGMIMVDSQAMLFKLALILTTLFVLGFSLDYREYSNILTGTYASLVLFGLVGMMFLVGSIDFLMAVISLELLGIASFVLTGFILNRKSSVEGAIKFFLVGTLSTAVFLFGVSYYYGYFGTTSLNPLINFASSGQSPDFVLSLVMIFLISGIGFKLAMVPFHMWAPDAYEGAPTPITAFLSVAPKAAAIGFLLRMLSNHAAMEITPILAILAALTMTVGNVGALHQTNVKRLLAYSSVAQIGYILVALVVGGSLGIEATIFYTLVYLFMNLGVFAVLIIVSNASNSDDILTFAGLSKQSLGLSISLVVLLLSMAGIPPLAGFIGKFAIFAAVIKKSGFLWLGIVAVLNSVVSLYYYFRIAQQAFFKEPGELSAKPAYSVVLVTCLALCVGVTIVIGILPNHVLGWVRNVVGS